MFRKGFGRWDGVPGGAIAGMIAGVVLSAYVAAMNLVAGRDVWIGAKAAARPFLGDAAMRPGFDGWPVALGITCHFLVSAAWGALFGWLCLGRSRCATVFLGIAWGLIVWVGMLYVVLPIVGAAEIAHQVPIGSAIAGHLLFGVALALGFLPVQSPRREWGTGPFTSPQELKETTDEALSALNRLIETCWDREDGYRTARGAVQDIMLQNLFSMHAEQSTAFRNELEEVVRRVGGDPASHGTMEGLAMRGWMTIKAAASKDDTAMLEECELGEDAAVETYRQALTVSLPGSIRTMVGRQLTHLEEAHRRVRALRDSARMVYASR